MYAAAFGRQEIIEFLLFYEGIDISIKDATGRTALEICRDGRQCNKTVYPKCLEEFKRKPKNEEVSLKQAEMVQLADQLRNAQEQIK